MPGSVPRIYECRVTSVQGNARTLNAISRAGRRFNKISYLLPYMNSLGSGFDFMPQARDECIVLGSNEPGGLDVVIGFKMPIGPQGEGTNRLPAAEFPGGSQGIRVIGEDGSEAKILAFRGGVVLVGSGALANTIYTPLGVIKNIFDSWILEGPGGKVSWTRDAGSSTVEYDAEYRTKASKTEDGFRVNVHIGDGDVPVKLQVTRKKNDALPAMTIEVDSDGRLRIHGNIVSLEAYARLSLKAPSITINERIVLPTEDPI